MPEKSRGKNLSTRFLLPYKIFIWLLLTIVLALFCHETWVRFSSIVLTVSRGFILYRYYVMNQKLYHVEFDDKYLYVIRKNVDILVPLENVKGVNIKTLIGHYEVKEER